MKRITKFSRILLAGTAALALAGPATLGTGGSGPAFIQPAAAANIQIDFFYDPLSSHGSWIDHRRHGYVFIPAVGSGWRPYTHGHWVYTDAYGWYWESEEPFAWATYHYGRWGYDPAFGWYWVPGNVWGPAWVTWRYGGGNVGWAPIGPGDHDGYVYGTPDYYEPPVVEAWVFVPEQRMVALDVARYVTPVVEVNLFLGKARERHHVRYRDGRAYNGFLPRERVTKIVNKEINIYNITTVDSPDQLRRGNDRAKDRDRDGDRNTRQIRAFRTEIADTRPNERPRRVAKSADEIKSAPRLKQTAKGKRPEGAPPSVADLAKQDNIARPGDDSRRRDAAGPRPEERKPGDARSPDVKPRDGRSRDARSRDDRPGQVERRQDGAEKAKPADRKQTDREPADPKQTDRRENADRDNRKPKAAQPQPQPQQKQRERQNAAPKPDSRMQRSREAAPKRNDQPKGERRGSDRNSSQQKQQARPERQPQQQKQARPERQPQQKQATPPQNRNTRPQQKQATPERNRKAVPQRESRGAPQAQPNAKRQQRPAPQQAERQGRKEGPANRGGGRQKQERGGPNR